MLGHFVGVNDFGLVHGIGFGPGRIFLTEPKHFGHWSKCKIMEQNLFFGPVQKVLVRSKMILDQSKIMQKLQKDWALEMKKFFIICGRNLEIPTRMPTSVLLNTKLMCYQVTKPTLP